MSYQSPLDPGWTLTSVQLTLPSGLRYGGYELFALHATLGSAATVRAPVEATVRTQTGSSGELVVELEPLPFGAGQQVARSFTAGQPTIYLVFPAASSIVAADHQRVSAGEVLITTTSVDIVLAFPDRVARCCAGQASAVLAALQQAGASTSSWQSFTTEITSATELAGAPTVLLLDHAGAPLASGSFTVTVSGASHTVELAAVDQGDLEAAVRRQNTAGTLSLASLWPTGATSVTIQPVIPAGQTGDYQLVRIEDGSASATSITATPTARHIQLTNLHDWFASQYAIPQGQTSSPLARYSRGNRVSYFVDGESFFRDFFDRLQDARTAGGGLHLAGWAVDATSKFVKPPSGAPSDYPRTLEEAAERIASAGGACRFLAVDFYQIADPSTLQAAEGIALSLIVGTLLIFAGAPTIDFAKSDGSGMIILVALLIANAFIVSYLLDEGALALERNADPVDTLDAVSNSHALLSEYPAHIDDNPLPVTSDATKWIWTTLFKAVRHFGVYHQKLAVVHGTQGFAGYCGGIDVNTNRLATPAHLERSPFHDVHAKLEGPAVADLATTFAQRWGRDSSDPLAFSTPSAASLGTPGDQIVQVARTYFAPSSASRALSFAPSGDRTLIDSILAGIAAAREFIYIEDQYLTPSDEYLDALEAKVTAQEIRKLIIAVPGVTDQPYGDIRRSAVVSTLLAADTSGEIVRIGHPRRRFTVPTTDLRASSGRLLLRQDMTATFGDGLTIALGPLDRLPPPPFWVSVDGELMHVYDEDWLDATTSTRYFKVERGAGTKLVSGTAGAKVRSHKTGAAVTLVDLASIYVHSKLMIVDDVFLSVGSANLNRRGFYHDGECNTFVVPEALRGGSNPVRALRKQLWADMLDLPPSIVDPLLDDPLSASALFDRSWFYGNRYVPLDAQPSHPMGLDFAPGDGWVGFVLGALGFTLAGLVHEELFDAVADPTTSLDPDA
jgi:phosphatidylserine/phosphatidylglycerophosphate/cardiolipin synthase-like enzyme